jgi:putative transcriptional regulator
MYWRNKPILENCVEVRRKERKMTQADLAMVCDVTRQTIISIEKGNYVPSVALAIALAKALATSVEDLFILKGEKS